MITLKGSLLWGKGDRKCLAGCTELTATYNAKELYQSQTAWGNKMNSLWLPPACDARNIVSSAQTEKSLLGTANKEPRETGLPASESLWPCLTTDCQCGSHIDRRGLTATLLWKAMVTGTYIWATLFCLHCLVSDRDMDDPSWHKHSASAEDTMHPIKWYRRMYS